MQYDCQRRRYNFLISQQQKLSPFCKDFIKPEVEDCPGNLLVVLQRHEKNRAVFWSEPTFTDNVGIDKIIKSQVKQKSPLSLRSKTSKFFRNRELR